MSAEILPADDWHKPGAPLAAGLRKGPPPPIAKLELEPVVNDAYSDAPLPIDIQDLQAVCQTLKRDNLLLMKQIEEAWLIIKSRDETISYLQQGQM